MDDSGGHRLHDAGSVTQLTPHPERFVRGLPQPPALPAVVWLNPPPPEEKARSETAELH